MKNFLTPVFVILAALALMTGGLYAAVFTVTDADQGDLSAATLSITVLGTDTNTLDFELVSQPGTDCDAIFPDDSCTDLVRVTNNSTVPVTLAIPTAAEYGDLETCGDGDQLSTTFDLDYTPGTTTIGIGGEATFDIITTFLASSTQELTDTCQGETGTVVVTVVATAAP